METRKLKLELDKLDFSNSFLFGFYGGGNMGDELILEVLLNYFKSRNIKNTQFIYLNSEIYSDSHHSFEEARLIKPSIMGVLKALFVSKRTIIGGGGLWGLDFNLKVLILSFLLLAARFVLRKEVYLIGVGYYKSTGMIGHFGAFISGLASNKIYARDEETYYSFSGLGFKRKVVLTQDIAFLLNNLNLEAYKVEAKSLFPIDPKQINYIVSYRGNSTTEISNYVAVIEKFIQYKSTDNFLLLALHPSFKNSMYSDVLEFQKLHANLLNTDRIIIKNFSGNPISFYLFLRNNKESLVCILPQYHGMLLAALSGVKYIPISYDNKCTQLLKSLGQKDEAILDISKIYIQNLISFNNK